MNRDGHIDVCDIKYTVEIILEQSKTLVADNYAGLPSSANALQAKRTDDNTVVLSVSGPEDLTAIQADIELPDGLEIESASFPTDGKGTHTVSIAAVEKNLSRLTIYSLDLASLNQGEIVLTLKGKCADQTAEMTVTNVIASAPDARSRKLSGASAPVGNAGMESVLTDSMPVCVYSTDGVLLFKDLQPSSLNSLGTGIYIVSQGSRHKKIHVR